MLAGSGSLAAEPGLHGTAEIGLGGVAIDERSAYYGKYTGITDDEVYWIGNLDLATEQEADYLKLRASDLDLDFRRISAEGGKYGRYSVGIAYLETPQVTAVGAKTAFQNAGGSALTLPGGFVPGETTSAMGGLGASLKTLDLRTQRREVEFDVSSVLARNWQAAFSFHREKKDGTRSLGSVVAESGGRADSVILPQPVDYETDDFEIGIAYADNQKQMEIAYLLSMFDNASQSITWEVPFTESAGGLEYPSTARIGLPPDNRYQHLSLTGGVNFLETSRASVAAEIGELSQDETLLPYSTDDIGGTAAVREDENALPRETSQASIDVAHLMLALSSRPLPRLGVSLRYRFHETDNKTPYTLFNRVVDDTAPQSATDAIYSRPYDSRRSTLDADGRYRFKNGTSLKAGYQHEIVDYDEYREIERAVEDTASIKLRKRFGNNLSARVAYSRAERDASDYSAFRSYRTLYDSISCPSVVTVDPDPDTGGTTDVDTCFRNHPDMRMYNLADRTRDRADIGLQFSPSEQLNMGLVLNDARERYTDAPEFDDTNLGLVSRDNTAATLDLGYSPNNDFWSVHMFYSNENSDSQQAGRAFGFGAGSAIDSSRNWRAILEDRINTVGLGGIFDLLWGRLTLQVDYIYVRESENIRFETGAALSALSLPEDKTERHTLSVNAPYELRENLDLNLGVEYEIYKSRDWSLESIEAGGIALDDVLPLVGPDLDYRALLISASAVYRW